MSRSLYIIDLPALNLPDPKNLQELWGLIEPRLEQEADVNPKFVELAKRVTARFPSRDMYTPGDPEAQDSVWLSSPLKEAEQTRSAVWHLGVLSDEYWPVVCEVVKHADTLGLTVLNDNEGFGHLPGNCVLPRERQEEWEELCEEVSEVKRLTPAQMRKTMRAVVAQHLALHGFALAEPPPPPSLETRALRRSTAVMCRVAGRGFG